MNSIQHLSYLALWLQTPILSYKQNISPSCACLDICIFTCSSLDHLANTSTYATLKFCRVFFIFNCSNCISKSSGLKLTHTRKDAFLWLLKQCISHIDHLTEADFNFKSIKLQQGWISLHLLQSRFSACK